MDKSVIKRIIIEKQDEVADIEAISRDAVLEPNANYVFIGLRRAGKSYLMFQHIHNLIKNWWCCTKYALYYTYPKLM